MNLKCQLVSQMTEGDQLWIDWEELMLNVRPGHRLFDPTWYYVWSETVGARGRWTGELSLLTVRDGEGTLQGILPVGQQKIGPASFASSAGDWQPWRTTIAHCDREAEVARAIGEFVANTGWNMLRLGPCVRSAATTSSLLATLQDFGTFTHLKMSVPLAICNAPDSWDEFCATVLKAKFLRKIGYYERRFARRGDLKIVHYRQPTLKQTAQMVKHLGDIEKRSWMASDANAHLRFATTAGQQQWTRLVYRSLSPNDQLDCWIMMFEGQPVSFCFTLTDLPVRYIIANSYDEQVKEHRTGSILFRYMVEDGINRGVRRFDYGDSEIHYKQLWGASYQDWLDTYLIVPNSVLGSVARPVRALKRLIRPEKVDIDPELDSILANTQLNQTTNSHRAENEALVEN